MRYETGLSNRLGNRANNQDRCSYLEHCGDVLLLLADGMGGHRGGDLAAQQFIDSMTMSLQRQKTPISDPADFLNASIVNAHLDISRLGAQHEPPFYPRTTCVACLVQDGIAWWAHVGDSRLYLIRNKDVLTRTRDHTYIEDLVKNNVITEDEMAEHPMRNYVSFCLGGAAEPPPVTLGKPTELLSDDVLLLCSDGLWNAVKMKKLLKLLDKKELEEALDAMTNKAEQATYPYSDNISAIAMRYINNLDRTGVNHASRGNLNTGYAATRQDDTLSLAIDNIQDAIHEYKRELDDK